MLQPLLFGGDYDHLDKRAADAAHLTPAANGAIDAAVDLLVPRLPEEEKRVKHALETAPSFKEAKTNCLYAASGCLKYMRLCIGLFVRYLVILYISECWYRCLSARPRDQKKAIVPASQTLHGMFASKNR